MSTTSRLKNWGSQELHWKDWKWQMRNRIHDVATFEELLGIRLAPAKRAELERSDEKFPISVTPYYLSLINTDDLENDPVFRQSMPSPLSDCIQVKPVARSLTVSSSLST